MLISRNKLSITAMVGIIMLAGIVVNNAILLNHPDHCLGMFPMALGIGSGVEFYKALAVVVIGGLMFSTILTLVIIPILYNIFEAGKLKISEGVKNLIRGES